MILDTFTTLTGEAQTLHDSMETALTLASPELVEEEQRKRRENTMKLRELTYLIDRELQKLDDMKRIVRIKQGWNTSDIKTLDAYRWSLVNERKHA